MMETQLQEMVVLQLVMLKQTTSVPVEVLLGQQILVQLVQLENHLMLLIQLVASLVEIVD